MSNSAPPYLKPPSSRQSPRLVAGTATFVTAAVLSLACGTGSAASKTEVELCSADRIGESLKAFTKDPHPFGSSAQLAFAQKLLSSIPAKDWITSTDTFSAQAPDVSTASPTPLLLRRNTTQRGFSLKTFEGVNVVAQRRGAADCAVVIGGHFDTKLFTNFRFVGANDGGSSTALLTELAHVIPKQKFKKSNWGACDLHLVFFDGEEAILPEWNDGERMYGVVDHLYGSRHYAQNETKQNGSARTLGGKKIALVFVVDMIGHAKQQLMITEGSDATATKGLLASKREVNLVKSSDYIEDDHAPFLEIGVPVLHVIDWTNLTEWHTSKDTVDAVSPQKIALFGDAIIRFLKTNRL